MKTLPAEIRVIEKRLKNQGVTVPDFCDYVGINRSTWTRWKAGNHTPSVLKWELVKSTFVILVQGTNNDA